MAYVLKPFRAALDGFSSQEMVVGKEYNFGSATAGLVKAGLVSLTPPKSEPAEEAVEEPEITAEPEPEPKGDADAPATESEEDEDADEESEPAEEAVEEGKPRRGRRRRG